MASTVFQDYNQNNPIVSAWLNDVNSATYTVAGTAKLAAQSAAAWVRFSVVAGIVTVQQSSNVSSVSRLGVGIYLVTYAKPLVNPFNCYGISLNQAGFGFMNAESTTTVTINTTNIAGGAVDPGTVSLQVFGAN
jgi:hypothetical protein